MNLYIKNSDRIEYLKTCENEDNIVMTIALPILNGRNIIWFPLESLKNQINITFDWELIVAEEYGKSKEYIKNYINCLPGCKKITYITIIPEEDGIYNRNNKIVYTLLQKWILMAKISAPNSKIFVKHAADCYSSPKRLYIHHEHFKDEKCYYSTQLKGIFFNIFTNQKMLYDGIKSKFWKQMTHLNMALRTKYMKTIDLVEKYSCIDNYIYFNMKKHISEDEKTESFIHYDYDIDPLNWKYSLDTDGYNQISLKRSTLYTKKNSKNNTFIIRDNVIRIRYKYKNMLNYIPKYIIDRLTNLRKMNKLKNNITLPIQMYDPKRDYNNHREEYDKSIQNILDTGLFINGPEVKQLEKELSIYAGTRHCICVSSGTDALMIALMALNVKKDDEVITVSHSWISTVEVIGVLQAKPVFVDINEDDFNMNHELLEDKINNNTKAIIVVSLYGQMADYDSINEIANKYNIPVIEDGAQSFGSTYKGKKSCSVTTIGCTSFFPSKPLGGYGDGGACFTNDDMLDEKIRSIKNNGCLKRFEHNYIGINSRYDTMKASILKVKLKYLDDILAKRNIVANKYTELLLPLEKSGLIKLPKTLSHNTHVWAQYSIIVKNKLFRDELVNSLKENGINVSVFYPKPIHTQKCFKYLNVNDKELQVTHDICDTVINLPCYAELTQNETLYISHVFQSLVQ